MPLTGDYAPSTSAWAREQAERYVIPVASGLIAGESIIGVVVALLGATVFAGK